MRLWNKNGRLLRAFFAQRGPVLLNTGALLSVALLGVLMWMSFQTQFRLRRENVSKVKIMEQKSELGRQMEWFAYELERQLSRSQLPKRHNLDSTAVSINRHLDTIKLLIPEHFEKVFESLSITWDSISNYRHSTAPRHDTQFSANLQERVELFQQQLFILSAENEYEVQLANIRGELMFMDEALSNFAHQYVITKDTVWRDRYRIYGHEMDFLLEKAQKMLPEQEATRVLVEANTALSKIELEVFERMETNDTIAARALLNSISHGVEKKRFQIGLKAIQEQYQKRLTEVLEKEMRVENTRFAMAFLLLLTTCCFVIYIMVLRRRLQGRNLQLAGKNAELETFAYAVSHDLKAPLRVTSNLIALVARREARTLSEDSLTDLKLVREQNARLLENIDALLQYARAGYADTPAERVNPKSELLEIAKLYESEHSVQFSFPEHCPHVMVPVALLRQVLQNLVSNAVKYNGKEEKKVRFEARALGRFAEFALSDNGPGIATEHAETIFHLFETLRQRPSADSTGIGLSIVRKNIESMGGSISLDTTYRDGARFVFLLPLA